MGFFSAIKSGLAKTRNAILGEIKGIAGKGKVTDEMLEDLEERLIKADVGTSAAFMLTDALREEALGKSLSESEVLDILRSEAERFLVDPPKFEFKGKPHVVLVIGVNGAGKTTTIGKLAKKFADEGRKVMIAAADTFRAAAIEQLEVWAERAGAEFVRHAEGSDPAAVAFDACAAAKARGCDIVFIDTAGRLQNKDYLMEELAKIVRVLKKQDTAYPHDMMLVIDGNTGQNAISQAKIFNQSFPLTGLVVTKLDGTAHGGSVLSIASSLKVPICWVGMGERIDQLVPFCKAEYVEGLFKE